MTDAAAEGSDRQLLGFRHAVATCADAATLRRWLDGHDLPPGLPLDPEGHICPRQNGHRAAAP